MLRVRLVIRSTFTPGPSSTSYRVTVGPRLKPVTAQSTSNSANTCCSEAITSSLALVCSRCGAPCGEILERRQRVHARTAGRARAASAVDRRQVLLDLRRLRGLRGRRRARPVRRRRPAGSWCTVGQRLVGRPDRPRARVRERRLRSAWARPRSRRRLRRASSAAAAARPVNSSRTYPSQDGQRRRGHDQAAERADDAAAAGRPAPPTRRASQRAADQRTDRAAGVRAAVRGRGRVGPEVEQAEHRDGERERADDACRPRESGCGAWRSMCAAAAEQHDRQQQPRRCRSRPARATDRPWPTGPAAPNQTRRSMTRPKASTPSATPSRRCSGSRSRAVAALRPAARATPPTTRRERAPERTRAACPSREERQQEWRRRALRPRGRRARRPRVDREVVLAGGRAGAGRRACHPATLTLNSTVTGERATPAHGAESPAAARSARRWLISCSVASTSGGRTGPTSRPRSRSPALTRIVPCVRKMPV